MNAIFIRCSTENQTPELQLNDILSMNPPSDAVIYREQLSAWKENIKRPEFEKILSKIRSRQISTLYVWNLDRLYRNRKRLVEFLALCHRCNVKVFSYNQKWLDSIMTMDEPFNEIMYNLMLQILGWIGESESTTKSNRVKMAVKHTAGVTVSYKGNKWGRKSLPKQTISRVLGLHSEGKSIRQIAAAVQVYDKNNNGRNISVGAVHKILAESKAQKDSISSCSQAV